MTRLDIDAEPWVQAQHLFEDHKWTIRAWRWGIKMGPLALSAWKFKGERGYVSACWMNRERLTLHPSGIKWGIYI